LQNTLSFLQYFIIPEPHNLVAIFAQALSSCLILNYHLSMLPTVNLDNQLLFHTHEVHDKGANDMLAAKFPSTKSPIAEAKPKHTFSIC
jgi:hypothetical protein